MSKWICIFLLFCAVLGGVFYSKRPALVDFWYSMNIEKIKQKNLALMEQKTWWVPKPDSPWNYHIHDTNFQPITGEGEKVYILDLFDTPQETIDMIHAKGDRVICYFSLGTYEHWRPDAHKFPEDVKAKKMKDWDEYWLNIKKMSVLYPIMTARLDLAVEKKCDGVDPDNVDSWINNIAGNGNPDSTFEDQYNYNIVFAYEAHKRGLATGLKNDLKQVEALVDHFDFAVNEVCHYYKECWYYDPFLAQNKTVFGVEYTMAKEDFCQAAIDKKLNFLKKPDNRALTYDWEPCDVFIASLNENTETEIVEPDTY